MLVVVAQALWAAEEAAEAKAKRGLIEARQQFEKHPGKVDPAWQLARACFDAADVATNNTERAAIAEQGINAARNAIALASNSAPAHYYLGLNLGELAQTRGLSALKLVKEMQREFSAARTLDETFDFAGPDRSLALLYYRAPSIGSIGSRSKAREHFKRAVELAPLYPDNRLNIIEALVKWGERETATEELKALKETLPAARVQFAGAAWNSDWADWEARLKKLTKKLDPPKPPETVHHKQG